MASVGGLFTVSSPILSIYEINFQNTPLV